MLRARPNRFRRGVAFVLLLLVTYSVTAEFVHNHGQALSARTTNATSVGDTSKSETTAKPFSTGVCLLCQFQQQLAHGLLHTPPFTFRPLLMTAAVVTLPNRYLPATNAPPRGRAPPPASPA
jgi:hypothetical protein